MLQLKGLRTDLVVALGVGLVASLGLVLYQRAQLAVCHRQRAAELESLRKLEEAIRRRDLEQPPAVADEGSPAGDGRAALAKREATIARLNRELSDARADAARLEVQLTSSSDERANALASANERHRKEQADWQSQLDELKRELDSAQAETQASRRRLTDLEADIAKANGENRDSAARAAEARRIGTKLQEVDRRREIHLTSIIRRYRDITNQFRAMSGMLDSTSGPSAKAFSGESLTRIQNAVDQADDDLRQLNDLNVQARQLEEKLVRK